MGSCIALALRERGNQIVVLDNLRRRGSELNIPHFRKTAIEFIHGDIRDLGDLANIPGNFDVLVEASAEPSVHAGQQNSPAYVIDTNLGGTVNCLEFARHRVDSLVFLSTSRVYSIAALRSIRLKETPQRLEIDEQQTLPGISEFGIAENFSIDGARSFYGATKLASELLIQEYVQSYRLKAVINRCGVIAGPGQFGKTDQGFVSLWVARHWFGMPLRYTGFGGTGKQVRDLLHPDDLIELLLKQLDCPDCWENGVFNVGGGRETSISLRELTELCREITGRTAAVESIEETSPVDIPLFVTDARRAGLIFNWQPRKKAIQIVDEIADWIQLNQEILSPIFGASKST